MYAGVFEICDVCVCRRYTGCVRGVCGVCVCAGGARDVRGAYMREVYGVRAGCTRGADGAFRARSGHGLSARSVRAGGAGCGVRAELRVR